MRYNHTHDLVASKREYKRVLYTKNNEKKNKQQSYDVLKKKFGHFIDFTYSHFCHILEMLGTKKIEKIKKNIFLNIIKLFCFLIFFNYFFT